MKFSRIILHMAFTGMIMLGFAGTVVTAEGTADKTTTDTSTLASGGGSVQGYAADTKMQFGTIVQLTSDKASKVSPATSKELGKMYGVTVDPNQLSLTISSGIDNEVYVATSGTYYVLVSSQGGVIKSGDYVTLSAVDGIAMKASTDQKIILGRAAGGFDGKNNIVGNTTLKDTSGQTSQTVSFGFIPVAINIQKNPEEKSTKANLPEQLQRLGQAVAEKPISPIRIYLSIIVTGLSIIVAIVALYSGIRNSIISIGRNPLSKKSIFRGLLEIIITSFLILIIGLFAVYLLLKL